MHELTGGSVPARLADIEVGRLFVRGTIPAAVPVAIVGSRKATAYGRRTAQILAGRLAAVGVPVVSGLAFGIDVAAHTAALAAGGQTIAVLPSGLDDRSVSPRSNLPVAKRIIEAGGALIAEYPPGTEARKEHYHRRNRLIAALADHVVVVEGALPSGSLVTAREAADLNRNVWAVPGQIDNLMSRGTNNLISEGAHPLVSIDEFLEEIGAVITRPPAAGNGILGHLGTTPRHIAELAETAGLPADALEAELTKLELVGAVRHVGGRHYVRS